MDWTDDGTMIIDGKLIVDAPIMILMNNLVTMDETGYNLCGFEEFAEAILSCLPASKLIPKKMKAYLEKISNKK
jgi:hypothetical protein